MMPEDLTDEFEALAKEEPWGRRQNARIAELEASLERLCRTCERAQDDRDAALSALRTAAEALEPFSNAVAKSDKTKSAVYIWVSAKDWVAARAAHSAAMKFLEGE